MNGWTDGRTDKQLNGGKDGKDGTIWEGGMNGWRDKGMVQYGREQHFLSSDQRSLAKIIIFFIMSVINHKISASLDGRIDKRIGLHKCLKHRHGVWLSCLKDSIQKANSESI